MSIVFIKGADSYGGNMTLKIGKSFQLVFGLIGRLKRVNARRQKREAFEKAFLAKITSPSFEDGHIHQLYQQGLRDIDTWFRQENTK